MAKTEQYTSDIDETPIEAGDLVTVIIVRATDQSSKTVYISEDQLGDLMEENETLGALVLSE
jgi:hypothetical protein